MRIAHICLAGAFTEGMGYQDNFLVDINTQDGHEVLVVSDCKRFEGPRIVETPAEDRVLANGARLVRLPFDWTGPKFLTNKIKRTRQLFPLLEKFKPEAILYHGVVGWELLTLRRYKLAHPDVRIYVDSHEDRHNSGTNWLSYSVQYRLLTRRLVHRILPYLESILYISAETRDFLIEVLDLPADRLEYYPLGGIVVPDEQRQMIRQKERDSLGITDDQIVFLHSGKMDSRKRTLDILEAFRKVVSPKARLIIIGSLENDIASAIQAAIESDNRVLFLGWKSRDDLTNIMCMADMYLQPGGQSASLQHAICCGLPVMVYPYPSHNLMVQGNGVFVRTTADMSMQMAQIINQPSEVAAMRAASYQVANDLLDYRKLAARVYK